MGDKPEGYSVGGKITRKLLKLFGPGDPGWNPPRKGKGASGELRGRSKKVFGTEGGRKAKGKEGGKK